MLEGEGAFESSSGAKGRFSVAPLQGRFVFLRPVGPEDYVRVRAAELGGELAVRWRYRGSTASPEQWAHNLWNGTLAQFLVIGRQEPTTPLGLVVVYQPNHQDGHAFLAAESFGARLASPLMIFGVTLFLDYVFTCWDFHKLYMEVAEYNFEQFASGVGRLYEVEARLRDHFWYGGRRWDQLILAVYRDRWRENARGLLEVARAPSEVRAHVRMPVATQDGQ